ncbi:MAG TPA: SusC/RagA family TonB-linked outer membrane protein [Longimicrobiaceae bacterium]|nr:SusC/RagA family TonB-linked outer membrane protein [Longimicrobiaceae bacterium]
MTLGRRFILALVASLSWAAALSAQGPTGTVSGRVVAAADQRPLAGAAVSVAERRTVTGADGRFTLTGVPAGTHTARASIIGFAEATQSVTVVAGQTATVDFALASRALELEGLTVAIGYGEQEARDVTGAVETVTPEEFNTGRVVSPEQLIQGKVAGVQVVDTGEPGGGINLRIRGGTSVTSSNEPLYVVDGVPLPVGGGLSAGRNPLNFLSPQDIESLTVLKDASSTAIYGSRGANGVVIIQTKSGARQGPAVTYSGSVSTSTVARRPDLLSAEEFRAVVAQRAPDKVALLGNASTDWYDAVLRTAAGQEHNASVSGTGDNMNYRLSLGYLGQEGIVQGSQTERISAALSYNHVLFNDRLSVRANVRGARTDDTFTPLGVLGDAARFAPTQPIQAGDSYFEWSSYPLGPNNPLAALALAQEDGRTYRSIGSLEAQYQLPFLAGLSNTTRVGYDVASSERRTFNPTSQQSQRESGQPGYFSRSTPTETNGVFDTFLNYTSRLGSTDSDIDATAGYSYEAFTGESPFIEARGLTTDLLGPNGIPTAQQMTSRIDNVRESRLASFFARVNYTLRDRYLLTLSVRRDGSSRFGPENQWGTFPAAALGWRVSQEPFMQGIGWVSDLKLRASWGVNGNQSFGDYLWISTYRPGDAQTQVQFGDEFVGTIRPSAVDPNIKWEETTSYNLGLDYGIFGGRFNGSIEYYSKDTDDLIFRVPVAAGTNLSNFVTTNVGSVRNRGFEFSLNSELLNGGDTGLNWDLSFNAATNSNELLRINSVGGGSEQILVGGISGGVGSTIQVLQPGFPVNSFLVYRHIRRDGRPIYADVNGLDPSTGKLTGRPDGKIDEQDLYEDLNGDGVINQADRAPFENPAPDWILGATSNLAFRNLDLSFTLRAYLGNYVYNNVASNRGNFRELSATGSPENLHPSALEYGFADPQYFSDVYVEDASFLRMDNLTLGYTVPSLRGMQNLRVFGTVQNVFTLTGYSGVDPSAVVPASIASPTGFGIDNNIYPRARTFTAGVSVGF